MLLKSHNKGLGDLAAAQFPVPQNPILLPTNAGIGLFQAAQFAVPENPLLRGLRSGGCGCVGLGCGCAGLPCPGPGCAGLGQLEFLGGAGSALLILGGALLLGRLLFSDPSVHRRQAIRAAKKKYPLRKRLLPEIYGYD